MIKIIDTYSKIGSLFNNSEFDLECWEAYINRIYDNAARIFWDDIEEYIASGKYSFDKDFLPIINAVRDNPKLDILHESFCAVTNDLNKRIEARFAKSLDIDVVLYLGLCNAAGWVTNINGADTILLGVEKIIELGWYDIDSMQGLVYHELGHSFQRQHGVLKCSTEDRRLNFVWQLFTEGIAMYFEQELIGDPDYYHQDSNGWKEWCDRHFAEILSDFDRDLADMEKSDQRYFGDWCDYHEHSDVGYYLGTRFVRHLLDSYRFDDLICMDQNCVYELYSDYVRLNTK